MVLSMAAMKVDKSKGVNTPHNRQFALVGFGSASSSSPRAATVSFEVSIIDGCWAGPRSIASWVDIVLRRR